MEEGSGVHENLGAQVTLSSIDSNHFQPFSVVAGVHWCIRGRTGGEDCIVEEEEHS